MDLLQNIEPLLHGISVSQMIILALILAGSGFISGLTEFGFGLFGVFSFWILDEPKPRAGWLVQPPTTALATWPQYFRSIPIRLSDARRG
jgi:hypothetical protein